MDTGIIVVLGVLFAGLMSGYTTRVAARGPEGFEAIRQQSWFRLLTGAPAFIALVAVIIWGFFNIPWYWVIGGFLGISLLIIPVLMSRRSFGLWYMVQPALDLLCLAGAIYIWLIY